MHTLLAEQGLGNRLHACMQQIACLHNNAFEYQGPRERGEEGNWRGGSLLVSSGNVIDAPLGIVLVSFTADVVVHCRHHLHMPHHTLFTPCLHAAAAIHCGVTDTGITYTCLTVGDGAGSCQVMQDFEGCTCLCYSHSNFYKLAVLHVACMVPLALRS